MVSTKCILPWILEFVVLNTRTSNEWTRSMSLDLNVRGFSYQRNQPRLVPRE